MSVSVSLCVVTASPPQQVRAFLQAWRPAVDEIVLARDERADERILGACSDLADRMFVVPPVPNMERCLGWLHEQCSEDWILRADDDELPSSALLAALPSLVAEREPTHYWLPRRWAYPTPHEFIAEGAWATDIQLRLVRNLPGLWRFAGVLHSNIEVLGAGRVLGEPLLHATALLHDAERRRAKVAAYQRLGPGLTHELGNPLDHVYLPEDAPALRRERLPAEDAQRVASFIEQAGAADVPIGGAGSEVARASVAELERWLEDRPVFPGAYAASVRLVHPVAPMRAGSLQHVQVEVTNLGDDWWPRGPRPRPEIAVGHRWRRADGSDIEIATPRTPFTETVPPGATTRLTVAIQAPPETGELELQVAPVHEWVRWFERPARQLVYVTGA